MLEVLPPGASKGHGVEVLLKHLGIDSLHLMALGERAWRSKRNTQQTNESGKRLSARAMLYGDVRFYDI